MSKYINGLPSLTCGTKSPAKIPVHSYLSSLVTTTSMCTEQSCHDAWDAWHMCTGGRLATNSMSTWGSPSFKDIVPCSNTWKYLRNLLYQMAATLQMTFSNAFSWAPLKFNGAHGSIQGNLTALELLLHHPIKGLHHNPQHLITCIIPQCQCYPRYFLVIDFNGAPENIQGNLTALEYVHISAAFYLLLFRVLLANWTSHNSGYYCSHLHHKQILCMLPARDKIT